MTTNRIIWGVIFFVGAILFAWMELDDPQASPVGWFLLTGLWSAFCGIGFTVMDWFIEK